MTPPKNVSPFPQKPMMDYMQLNIKDEELKEKIKCLFDTEEGQTAISIDKQDGNFDGTISASNWKNFVNSLFADKKCAEQYYLQEDSISTIDAADLIKEIKAKKEEVLEDGTVRKYNPDKSYSETYVDGSERNYDSKGNWVAGKEPSGHKYARFKKDDGTIIRISKKGIYREDEKKDNGIELTAITLNEEELYTDATLQRKKLYYKTYNNYLKEDILPIFSRSELERFIEEQKAYNRSFGL